MKTVEEFYKEIAGSQELMDELIALNTKEQLGEFLKKHGCGATADEYVKYAHSQHEGEIGDEEAAAAGGGYVLDITTLCPEKQAVP